MARQVHYIALTYKIIAEEGQYSAICEELGTATCGDTIDDAFHNLEEAVFVDLNALEQMGERDRLFKERGIRMYCAPLKSASKPSKVRINEIISRRNVPVYA